MVTIALEYKELAQLIKLLNGVVSETEKAVERAASINEPHAESHRQQLAQEYEQAHNLALKLSLYYENGDQP